MPYGLVKCDIGHTQSMEYQGYVRRPNWNQLYNFKYKCQICNCSSMYLITNYDPSFTIEKITVGTFGKVKYWSLDGLIAKEQDAIRRVLDENNFRLSTDSTKYDVVYSSLDNCKIVFRIFKGRKTQEMLLLTPAKHEIIEKVIEANKAEKRLKQKNSPPTPPIPTVQKDFLGDDVSVGDWVAYSSMGCTDLRVGRITKLNERSVTLMDKNGGKSIAGKALSQIIRISKERAVLLMLET